MRFIFSSKVALFGVIGYFSIACSGKIEKSDSKAHESYASTDSAMIEQPNAYERAQGQLQRKFVRTADLQFKVKDVRKSSEQIEDLTTRYDGFVTYSHLQSNIIAQKTVVISQDSLLEVSSVNIENAITIRVPNRYLLDILKELNSMMLYVDHRTIKADDVSMQMLSNDLANKRQEKFVKRNQTVHQNRKGSIAAAVEAEETLLSHQSIADENIIQSMSLQAQVDYSTITINIYQTTFLDKVMVENRERIDNYRTNVFVGIWDSLKTGWMFFEDLLVMLMRLWVFWLIGVVVFSYWKYKKRVQSPIKTH